ncbi:hypothetical protein RMATCC62417_03984 [Rhizopus microsporus]|nr:hypothetical protein RMATCC62417_03984 [Rhizopus microsporus]
MIDMDVMDRWSKFVESDIYSQLKEFQREGVKCAIERKGRLLIANEKGVGKVDEALAIAAVYRNEWPILVVCPEVLCLTWKYAIQQFFDLDDDEVQHLQEVKANTFNPSTVVKRKKQTTIRRTKKQRQINSQNVENDEEYIVNEEEKEEEEEEVIYKNSKPVQFYVVNHEVATRRRNLLKNVRFKMVICDGTQFVKARGNIHTKAFVTFLGDHPRLIMLSDTASHCLPAELFTGIQAVAPQLVSTFDKFAKRYCDPKQYIFGWIYDGKRNTEELDYILEKIIWHSPKMIDIASQLPRTIYETITAHIKREEKVNTDIDTALSVMEQTRIYMDMYEKTWQAKKKFIKSYFEYISQSFKESKIAIVLYHNEGLTEFKEYFNSKEIKFADVCNFDTIDQECQNFNTTVRIALIDMKLSGLDPGCLCAADIVICCEAPLQRSKAKQIESYFESEDRIGPLFIKYLMAPNTLDDIQWPIPDNTNGYE